MITEFRLTTRPDKQIGMVGKSKGKLRAFVIPNQETLVQAILDLEKKTGEIAPVWFDGQGPLALLGMPALQGSETNIERLCSILKEWEITK